MLTQQKLGAVASEDSTLSLVLFDEIEKAAASMTRLLLGVLDKAILRLGDNTAVNFERTLIFLTSNLGAREMRRELHPDFGFESLLPIAPRDVSKKLHGIGVGAMRRKFSPEFVNRIDAVITYQPLDTESLASSSTSKSRSWNATSKRASPKTPSKSPSPSPLATSSSSKAPAPNTAPAN